MSIPSRTWFPQSLQERAAWYANFAAKAVTLGTSVGLVAGDLTQINTDLATMEFLANSAIQVDAYADAIRQYRKIITEGDIGDPNPVFPGDLTFTPPGAVTGLFERLDKYVKRIRASPAYTDEIGAEFGILPSRSDDLVPDELKPTIKAMALPGSVLEVTFVRGKTDGILIETKIDNAGSWTSAGNYFKSPASLNIPDGTGLPHSVQIRGRYIIGNEAVGLNSDTVNVVTTP